MIGLLPWLTSFLLSPKQPNTNSPFQKSLAAK
jgi:hypothetical protein